jgi:hypothetical protein
LCEITTERERLAATLSVCGTETDHKQLTSDRKRRSVLAALLVLLGCTLLAAGISHKMVLQHHYGAHMFGDDLAQGARVSLTRKTLSPLKQAQQIPGRQEAASEQASQGLAQEAGTLKGARVGKSQHSKQDATAQHSVRQHRGSIPPCAINTGAAGVRSSDPVGVQM